MKSQNKNRMLIAALVTLAVLTLLVVAAGSGAPVYAQATSTPTFTPTPTNTPTTTPFPIAGSTKPEVTFLCRLGNVDCIQVRAGGQMHFYAANGTNTFSVNGETGAVTAKSLTLATPMAVLAYQTPGVRLKCGQDTITGTKAIAHGMATPQYVMANLAADATGDGNVVTSANSSATVTIKVWNSALTPAAATTPVAVDWCVVGQP